MNKAIIITFKNDIEYTREKFLKAGCPANTITMFNGVMRKGYLEKLIALIKKIRGETRHTMVVIHGQLHLAWIREMYEAVEATKASFDMNLGIYAFEAEIKIPGIEPVTPEEVAERLTKKAAE